MHNFASWRNCWTNLTLDGMLVQSLMRANLADEYVLLIHPLILGSGRRLFPDDGALAVLKLRYTKTTRKGVLIATYQPANSSQDA